MTTSIQRSGSRGEVSPDFWYRPDIAPWHSGFKKMSNFYTKKQGNVENRGGLQFVGEFENSATPGVLATFPITTQSQYVLEFTNQLLRFYYRGQYVSDTNAAITAFVNGVNPAISTSGVGGQFWNVGDSVYITGATGPMAQFINNRLFLISAWNGANPGTLKLTTPDGINIDSTAWGTVVLTNAVVNHVYQIATPFLTADLPYFTFTPFKQTMKIRHRNYSRYILSFINPTSWTLTVDNAWPAQVPASQLLVVVGGNAGALSYRYKVSTLNLITGEESFPGSVYPGSGSINALATYSSLAAAQAAWTCTIGSNVMNININGHGLLSGQFIQFSQIVSYGAFIGGFPQQAFAAGTNYVVTVIDANNFSVVGAINFPPNSGLGNSYITVPVPVSVQSFATSTAQTITALNTGTGVGGPVNVTVQAAHGLSTGDEVLIQATNIYGLDNLIFTITVLSSTSFYLNGTAATNYTAWFSGGIASGTAFNYACAAPTNANPNVLNWSLNPAVGSPAVNPIQYIIYLSIENGPFGFIATSNDTNYSDVGTSPTLAQTPLTYTPIFVGAGNQPGSCCYKDQRVLEFSTNNNPAFLAASAISYPNNFGTHNPIVANDAIVGTLAGNELTEILHAIDIGYVVLLTDKQPYMCVGDPNTGTIDPLPGGLGAKAQAYPGAAQIPVPIQSNKNILYVLKDGSTVYSLKVLQTLWGSYIGDYDDMTLLSFHLTSSDPIVRWAFQELPHHIFWVVTQSGKILSLTYDDKNGITAWAQHATITGIAESVCFAQEGTATAIYFIINRTIGGATKRFVERLAIHDQVDPRYYNFLDSSCTYDGTQWPGKLATWIFESTSLPVPAGQPGYYDDTDPNVYINISLPVFTAAMIGQVIQFPTLKDANGNPLSFLINSYTSAYSVGVIPSAQVAVAQQNAYMNNMASILAIQTVYGLWNLNGQNVSVLADGFEEANALTDAAPLTVVNGSVTLSEPYGVITIGLPILAQLETLPFDIPQNGTVIDQKKLFNKVNLGVYNTRGVFIGPEFGNPTDPARPYTQGMVELKERKVKDGQYTPPPLITDAVQEIVNGAWDFRGTVCIQQTSPLPVTISTIAPSWKE